MMGVKRYTIFGVVGLHGKNVVGADDYDALAARLAEAVALITIAEGITLTGTGVPALPMAIRERMDAWLRAADSATPAISQWLSDDEAQCAVCGAMLELVRPGKWQHIGECRPTETVTGEQK